VERIKWYTKTSINMVSLIIFSVRTDRLWQHQYLSSHWRHYCGMLTFTAVAWIPQLMDTFGPYIIGHSPVPRISFTLGASLCISSLFLYILGISFFFHLIGPRLRRRSGVAYTLKLWEYFVTTLWQLQTLGFWALTITTPLFVENFKEIPEVSTTVVGLLFVVAGVCFKASAIYDTGYNTYYWYDMVTEIPNAYFCKTGIYRCCGSPTYTLGRFTGLGVAILYRSVPILVAALVDLVFINLFNVLIEQPFVMTMYKDKQQEDENHFVQGIKTFTDQKGDPTEQ